LFLHAFGLRAHRAMLIQNQRQDGNVSTAKRVKRQQCVIDPPQAELPNHNRW
jgi:hypothetical protein